MAQNPRTPATARSQRQAGIESVRRSKSNYHQRCPTRAELAHVDRELAAIESAGREDLINRWHTLTRRDPPPRISIETMRLVLAHDLQVSVFGDIPPEIQRVLDRALQASEPVTSRRPANPPSLRPGAQLIREWRGEKHHVEVMERGFAYRGRLYRSLSEIARLITGARWNGPKFFGLRAPKPIPGAADG